MTKLKSAAEEFLGHRRIAVTGVSRKPKGNSGNIVYRRLRDRGYDVVAINPNADTVEGDVCSHDLKSVPGGVEAVVVCTNPSAAEDTVRECVDLGIRHVWMHRAFDAGSVSEDAARYGREHGVAVIDGGCPCMFAPTADPGHRVMKAVLTVAGKLPREV